MYNIAIASRSLQGASERCKQSLIGHGTVRTVTHEHPSGRPVGKNEGVVFKWSMVVWSVEDAPFCARSVEHTRHYVAVSVEHAPK